MSKELFISYASADLPLAQELHRRLLASGFSEDQIWFDKLRLNPGCNWYAEIKAGADAARILLPVLTPRWRLSNWTKFETYGGEVVIPLLFAGSWSEVSTPPLQPWQSLAIDLSNPDGLAWQRLADAIRDQLAKPAAERLKRLTILRYDPNPCFVGRETEMLAIHETLHQAPTADRTQGKTCVVAGMGGVGKTTLARQYVEMFWRCYPQIFWVDCREGVVTGFAKIYQLLEPQRALSMKVPEQAEQAVGQLNTEHVRLLVLDNAEDHVSVRQWIPSAGGCRTIITSRYSHWNSPAIARLEMDVLQPEHSRQFLVKRTGRSAEGKELRACNELAGALGHLPLALEQAAAYMLNNQQDSFRGYLDLYRRAQHELLEEKVLGSTHYPDPVATTWKLTIEKLSAPARAALRLASFLADTPIPLAMFRTGVETIREVAKDFAAAHPGSTSTDAQFFVNKIANVLHGYSMARWSGDTLQFHNLVQAVEQHNIPSDQRDPACRGVWGMFQAFAPTPADEFTNWPTWSVLLPHARRLAKDHVTDGASTAGVLNDTASYLQAQGAYAEAEPLFREALGIDRQALPAGHPDIATSLINLASLLYAQGKLSEAEPLYREALGIWQQALPAGHPDIAPSLNNLALLLEAQGKLAEAEPLFREALGIRRQALPAGHPDIATSLYNLASLLQDQGKLSEAEPLFREALGICQQALPAGHPDIATSLNNLASLLQAQGKLAEAEPLVREVLQIRTGAPGADRDVQLAIDLNNFALQLRKQGRLPEAEPYLRRALEIDITARGESHPKIPHRLNNLCTVLVMQGKLNEARRELARAWKLKVGQHDLTSSRVVFVRLAVALLEERPAETFIGQLETLLCGEPLQDYANVAKPWEIGYFIDALRPKLAEGWADGLAALAEAMNDPARAAELDRLDWWKDQPALLDLPWAEE